MRTRRLSSVLLDGRSLSVESVVLRTSEGVLGGRMALWQADRGSLGEALGGAHEDTLRKHFRGCLEERLWSWAWWYRDSEERQTTLGSVTMYGHGTWTGINLGLFELSSIIRTYPASSAFCYICACSNNPSVRQM